MGQLFGLVVAVQVARRLREGGVGPATDDDAVLPLAHRFDDVACASSPSG